MGAGEITYNVLTRAAELVTPAEPTPREYKNFSNLDFQGATTCQISGIWFYANHKNNKKQEDPATVIKEALSKALVFYYPFAGRIRQGDGTKRPHLDCTGEGILFVEGDADVSLYQLGNPIVPPIPCSEQLLKNVEGTEGLYDTPPLLIQVTRFRCGGFSVAIRLNHIMADAGGLVQLLKATAEIATSSSSIPSVLPVWKRELLLPRNPPRISYDHCEYDLDGEPLKFEDSVIRTFVLRKKDVNSLRRTLPEEIQKTTTLFDVLAALGWRCRVAALGLDPRRRVRIMTIVSGRGRCTEVIPIGYYGNSFAHPATFSTAGELCGNPFSYAVELISKGKSVVGADYLRSVADLIEQKEHVTFTSSVGATILSDLRGLSLREVDYGWGNALVSAPFEALDVAHFCFSCATKDGEEGVALMLRLPPPTLEKFAAELDALIKAVP